MVKEPTSNPAAGGHGRGTTLWRGLVATLVLLGAAFAQTRGPCFATVVGPDGKPIVGAEVTCAFSPDPVQPWRADVVRATTDARGRAKCDLLVGRPYVAWAIGPADGSGFRWSSQPLPLVGAGRVFDLRAEDKCASRQVPVASLAPWREAGAAGLRWFPVQGLHVFVDLPLPAGDTVELPPSPRTTGCLAVHDAKGEVLVATTVAEGASAEKAFGAPVAVAMQVVDTAGAPVAGATIEYEVPCGFSTSMFTARYRGLTTRCVGTTDDAGKLQGYVTKAPGSWGILVTAGKPGWSCDHAAVEGAGNIRFTLGKAPPVAVRVVGTKDAAVDFAALGSFQVARRDSVLFGHRRLSQEAHGKSWLLYGAAEVVSPRLSLATSVPTLVVTNFVGVTAAGCVLDLADTTNVSLRVLGVDGGPACAVLGVFRLEEGAPLPWEGVLATDVGGRAATLVPPGDFFVYATNGSAHALARLDRERTTPLELHLAALPTMRVLVRDANGEPVAGAHAVACLGRVGRTLADLMDNQWRRMAFACCPAYTSLARSGRDGVLEIPVFLHEGYEANVQISGAVGQSERFPLKAGGAKEVVLR